MKLCGQVFLLIFCSRENLRKFIGKEVRFTLFLHRMTINIITVSDEQYRLVLNLRQAILRTPLGLDLTEEDLSDEVNQVIFTASAMDEVFACVIAKPLDETHWKLRQMAVWEEKQGKGIGRQLILAVEQEALERGIKQISLHARETALDFYRKLGYSEEGEPFNEVGIPHRYMVKEITSMAFE